MISNCYSRVDVSGDDSVGGLVGRQRGLSLISNCYATGPVYGSSRIGGLVGSNDGGSEDNSFWDVNSSGQDSSDGGTGKTTAEMQMESTFTDGGWDFVGETVNGANDIWDICDGTNYARLEWEKSPGYFVCPDGVNFLDYAYFMQRWMQSGCGECDGADMSGEGDVDGKDLRLFCDLWLTGM